MSNNSLSTVSNLSTQIIQKNQGNQLLTGITNVFASGMKLALAVEIPSSGLKRDRLPMLKELVQAGASQKLAALLTGMSQSYASKLLNE